MNLNELLNNLKDRGLNSLIQSILVDHIEHIFTEDELESLENELNHINSEKETLEAQYDATQETINTYESNLSSIRQTRNILIITTILGAAVAYTST